MVNTLMVNASVSMDFKDGSATAKSDVKMMDFLVMKSVCVDKGSLVIDVNILFLTR
jgi:hypothetical protein